MESIIFRGFLHLERSSWTVILFETFSANQSERVLTHARKKKSGEKGRKKSVTMHVHEVSMSALQILKSELCFSFSSSRRRYASSGKLDNIYVTRVHTGLTFRFLIPMDSEGPSLFFRGDEGFAGLKCGLDGIFRELRRGRIYARNQVCVCNIVHKEIYGITHGQHKSFSSPVNA